MSRNLTVRSAVRAGLIAGVVMVYLVAVGIASAFAKREVVTGFLTLGHLMLVLPAVGIGYILAGRPISNSLRITHAAAAGLAAGLLFAAAFLAAEALSPGIRTVLNRVSTDLLAFVGFRDLGLEPAAGAALNVAIPTALAVIAALVRVAPTSVRRAIVGGATAMVLLSMVEPFLRPRLLQFGVPLVAQFIYKSHGLSTASAAIVLVIGAVLATIWPGARSAARNRVAAADPGTRKMLRWATILVGIAFLYTLPVISGSFLTQVLVLVGFYVLLGLGLNIVVGYAGLLDLGYVAFYAVGAYFTALITSPTSALGWGLNWWVALPIVIVLSAMVGLFIGAPVLRLRGDYLAIVTLGFGEIARVLLGSDALKPWLGGPNGILSVPFMIDDGTYFLPIVGKVTGPAATYFPLMGFCILAAFIAYRLKYSRTGRAWNAMREDEDVAQATGISTVNYKLLAFAMGAAVGCVGGAIYATHLQGVVPGGFVLQVSITVLAVVVLGGMGSIPGIIVGALALIGLPELLREFAEYKVLVYGAVLVAVMLLRPEGLIPDASRRAELEEAREIEEGELKVEYDEITGDA
ncbi:MAG TPA: leucine/isoleucine/valine transporter permease subunit [Methylomirabilota bacterium]|jgi:branched-chain amino acid transport system permease protein|nr:leucine/isoleucine/valine transporter permease subunit [Methylomirabilota bacterium]